METIYFFIILDSWPTTTTCCFSPGLKLIVAHICLLSANHLLLTAIICQYLVALQMSHNDPPPPLTLTPPPWHACTTCIVQWRCAWHSLPLTMNCLSVGTGLILLPSHGHNLTALPLHSICFRLKQNQFFMSHFIVASEPLYALKQLWA